MAAVPEDVQHVLRVLRQHVQTDQLLGVSAVPRGAAGALVGAAAAAPVAVQSPTGGLPDDVTPASRLSEAGPAAARRPVPPVAVPKRNTGTPGPEQPLTRQVKIQVLADMDVNEVRGCTACVLCQGRTQTVFGEGDPDARLMFVGEGPGETEDRLGRPFVGRAGELLNKMILAMGLTREQVFIANIVKCRPPNNRAPTPQEVVACSGFLRRQIQTINPAVIVTLGGPAAKHLLNTTVGITAIRGTWHQYEGLLPEGPSVAVMPTFHPAYLLRAYTEDNRRKVWSDLRQVMDRLGPARRCGIQGRT
jgi:uracil-DNA glycosylase